MTFYGRIGMGELEDDDDSPSAERERLARIKSKLCDPVFRRSLKVPRKPRQKTERTTATTETT